MVLKKIHAHEGSRNVLSMVRYIIELGFLVGLARKERSRNPEVNRNMGLSRLTYDYDIL
jgi:hypothetical protein